MQPVRRQAVGCIPSDAAQQQLLLLRGRLRRLPPSFLPSNAVRPLPSVTTTPTPKPNNLIYSPIKPKSPAATSLPGDNSPQKKLLKPGPQLARSDPATFCRIRVLTHHAAQRHDCPELPVRRLARLQRWREIGRRAALAKCGLAHGAASSDEPAIGPAVAQHAKRRQAPQNWRRRRDRRGRRRDHRRSRRAPMLESSSGPPPSAESPLASSHHQRKWSPRAADQG